MPAMRIRFPGGRYHATPWGHHVNEGLIEWPPCPWRLLRAFIATGYAKLGWGEAVPDAARRLIEALATTLPRYKLPPAGGAHSRHYMPLGTLDKGREKTTLVFDTWADVGEGELVIHWDCALDDDARELFGQLAAQLGYLGRSESWVEAEALDDVEPCPEFNAYPHTVGHNPGQGWEQVSLIAAEQPADYAAWRQKAVEQARRQAEDEVRNTAKAKGKNPTKARIKKACDRASAPYPSDLLDCLQRDTVWWKKYHWSQPPGSHRVIYWRRTDALQVGVPQRISQHRTARPITAVLLALTTPRGNKSALPHVSRTLPQAELLHAAIIRRVANGQAVHCPELTGRDENGGVLAHGHKHAHIIPLDLDGDQRLDHTLIYAPMKLRDAAQRAIRDLKRTWTKGGIGDLQLAIAGCGELDDLRRLPNPFKQQIERLLGAEQGTRRWIGVTPFVPPRHMKRHGRNTIAGQINAELASRGLPQAEVMLHAAGSDLQRRFRHFVLTRKRGGSPPPKNTGFTLELRFGVPVSGPLALGYGCHFGLGLFAARDE